MAGRRAARIDGLDGGARRPAGASAGTLAGSEEREVKIIFPNGMGYRFGGAEYLAGFALPNFYFHATTAYAILRNAGVQLGKPDFLAHLGPPNIGG